MSHTYHKPSGIQVVAWIEVVWGALVVVGSIAISQSSASANVDPGARAAVALFAAAIGTFVIAIGLGLRSMRRWAFIANLAFLGFMIFSGLVGGRLFDVLIASAFMAYLLKVREVFSENDHVEGVSLRQARETAPEAAPLECRTSAAN